MSKRKPNTAAKLANLSRRVGIPSDQLQSYADAMGLDVETYVASLETSRSRLGCLDVGDDNDPLAGLD